MDTRLTLISDIEAFCTRHGCSIASFGKNAANDGKLLARLRRGGDITLYTYDRIYEWMREHERRIAQAQQPSRDEPRAQSEAKRPSQKATPHLSLGAIETF